MFLKHIQVRIEDEKLYEAFLKKLKKQGMSQQGFGVKAVKEFVGPFRKNKKKKKKLKVKK